MAHGSVCHRQSHPAQPVRDALAAAHRPRVGGRAVPAGRWRSAASAVVIHSVGLKSSESYSPCFCDDCCCPFCCPCCCDCRGGGCIDDSVGSTLGRVGLVPCVLFILVDNLSASLSSSPILHLLRLSLAVNELDMRYFKTWGYQYTVTPASTNCPSLNLSGSVKNMYGSSGSSE